MSVFRRLLNVNANARRTLAAKSADVSVEKPPKKAYDLIGPADKISNLRKYSYYVPENESRLEYEYRRLREQVHAFNHQYWTEQNLKFLEARKRFVATYRVKQKLKGSAGASKDPDTTEMNEFYRTFLNENYYNHYEYNRKWIRYNFSLLWPATKVFFYRLNKRIFS